MQWELQGDMVQIQLAARMREDQYMAFGLSGEQGRSYMIGGDVVVAFYDSERGSFRVEDYYMSATAQVSHPVNINNYFLIFAYIFSKCKFFFSKFIRYSNNSLY